MTILPCVSSGAQASGWLFSYLMATILVLIIFQSGLNVFAFGSSSCMRRVLIVVMSLRRVSRFVICNSVSAPGRWSRVHGELHP